MKVSIKKISEPRPGTDYWDDKWLISVNGETIAETWDKESAELLAQALRQYKVK